MSHTVTIGFECKAFLLTGTRATWGTLAAGITSGAAPTGLAEVKAIRDAKVNLAGAEADVSLRASGFKLMRTSLFELTVDLVVPWQPADANFQAILGAFLSRGMVAMAFLDGDKA